MNNVNYLRPIIDFKEEPTQPLRFRFNQHSFDVEHVQTGKFFRFSHPTVNREYRLNHVDTTTAVGIAKSGTVSYLFRGLIMQGPPNIATNRPPLFRNVRGRRRGMIHLTEQDARRADQTRIYKDQLVHSMDVFIRKYWLIINFSMKAIADQ
ncbi:unnamed protein product, partial [Mesorhabditis belari]|uniref:Uncharacterized protein n=1 Tax=Mesorhabditis belari TaxID=2138241 RepID=A0AAF3ECS1_9BILA